MQLEKNHGTPFPHSKKYWNPKTRDVTLVIPSGAETFEAHRIAPPKNSTHRPSCRPLDLSQRRTDRLLPTRQAHRQCVRRDVNESLRDECLNVHWFETITESRRLIEARRIDYDESRPHMALGNIPPGEYVCVQELRQANCSRKLKLDLDHQSQMLQAISQLTFHLGRSMQVDH